MIFGEGFPCDFQVRNWYRVYQLYHVYRIEQGPTLGLSHVRRDPSWLVKVEMHFRCRSKEGIAPRDQLGLRDMQKNNQKHQIKKVECFQKPFRGKNMFKVILLAPPTLASAAPLSFWGTEGVSGGLPIHPRKVLPWMKHHILFCTVLHDAVYIYIGFFL